MDSNLIIVFRSGEIKLFRSVSFVSYGVSHRRTYLRFCVCDDEFYYFIKDIEFHSVYLN